jgi:hypothetical protein
MVSATDSRRERNGGVIDALLGLVEKKPRWGFWKLFPRLRRLGHLWNHSGCIACIAL